MSAILTFAKVRKGSKFIVDGDLYLKVDAGHGRPYWDDDATPKTFDPETVVDKPSKPKSRPQRWADAIGEAQSALDEMEALKQRVADAFEALNDLRSEYEDWHGNLPENLQQSALGEKLETIVGLDLDVDVDSESFDDLRSKLDGAEAADLPRGFGDD